MLKKRKTDREFDLHIWKQAETKETVATFTVSIGKRVLCHYAPIDAALDTIRAEMEEDE